MCARFGVDTYISALDPLLDRNYRAMKTLLEMVFKDGETISFTDYICDDGVGYGPYELKLSLTRTGEKVLLDFTGSSPQAQGPINYYINENLVRMFFGIYMITVADPQILWNDGFYPLVDVKIPEESFWKPKYPAALNARNHGIGRVFDLFGGLLGQTNPDLLNAAGFSSSPHFMYSGNYSSGDRKGEWFQLYSIGFGGIPGRPIGDGPDGHSLWPSFVNIPCEYLESLLPAADRAVGDRRGHRRRGPASRRQRRRRRLPIPRAGHHRDPRRPLADLSMGRQRRRAGRPRPQVGRAGRRHHRGAAQQDPRRPGRAGDLLHFVTWGGGGWGDPLARDPELVGLEVRRGLVTGEGARRYGVVCDEQGRSTPTRPRSCGPSCGRTARPAADLQHGPAAGGDPGAVRGGDRAAGAEAADRTVSEARALRSTRASVARSARDGGRRCSPST